MLFSIIATAAVVLEVFLVLIQVKPVKLIVVCNKMGVVRRRSQVSVEFLGWTESFFSNKTRIYESSLFSSKR